MGDDFTTTQSISISRVAVFDDNGTGTSTPLTWQLFNVGTGALIHTEIVAPTGPRAAVGTIDGNYVFQSLLTPIVLAAGQD